MDFASSFFGALSKVVSKRVSLAVCGSCLQVRGRGR